MNQTPWRRLEGDTLILELDVQPRASRDEVTGVRGGRLKVRVSAAPAEGAANARLKEFLAREFGVSRGRVQLLSGESRRRKQVAVIAPKRFPPWAGGSK